MGIGTSPLRSTEFIPTSEKPSSPGYMSQSKTIYRVCAFSLLPWCICMPGQHVFTQVVPGSQLMSCHALQAVSSIPSLYVYHIAHDNDAMNTQKKLEETFRALGDVTEAYFVVPPDSKVEDLSAIVKFSSWTDAEKAFHGMMDDVNSNNTTCRVKYARPRTTGEEEAISPKRLFIGQVSESISEEHLRKYFDQFGTIVEVSLLKSKERGPGAGCAFIEYDTWAACDAAIHASDGKVVLTTITENDDETASPVSSSKSLVVKYAKSKPISVHCYPGTGSATDMPIMGSPDSFWMGSVGHYLPIMFHDPVMYHPFYFTPYYHPMMTSDTRVDADSRKIFIGQLPRNVDENDLVNAFGHCGAIESVSILRGDSGRSQGCGFVTFFAREHALHAVQEMHGVPFLPHKKPMVVRFASRRTQHTS